MQIIFTHLSRASKRRPWTSLDRFLCILVKRFSVTRQTIKIWKLSVCLYIYIYCMCNHNCHIWSDLLGFNVVLTISQLYHVGQFTYSCIFWFSHTSTPHNNLPNCDIWKHKVKLWKLSVCLYIYCTCNEWMYIVLWRIDS